MREELGPVDVLINHAGNASWKDFHELTPDEFELSWRVCAYGSFLCAKEVVGDMLSAGGGAILFTGATSSIRGRAGAIALAVPSFGAGFGLGIGPRTVAQRHSRGPVIIDGVLDTPLCAREGMSRRANRS